MKKLTLSIVITLVSLLGFSTQGLAIENECKYTNLDYCDSVLTNGLEGNQTTLFYMYSNENEHFFLDPLSNFENVIFVEFSNALNLDSEWWHVGKRFVGTFVDTDLVELESLDEVIYLELEEN